MKIQDISIKTADEHDADQLYRMLIRSNRGKADITLADLRLDLKNENNLDGQLETANHWDDSFVIDLNMIKPNCSICQALLAFRGEQMIGYIIYHYYYSPWSGRMPFINDIFVEPHFRRNGIAWRLIKRLSDLCRQNNYKSILFNVTDIDSELWHSMRKHNLKIVRNDTTDWSVFRVEF